MFLAASQPTAFAPPILGTAEHFPIYRGVGDIELSVV